MSEEGEPPQGEAPPADVPPPPVEPSTPAVEVLPPPPPTFAPPSTPAIPPPPIEAPPAPTPRRWKLPVIIAVLAIIAVSVAVPIALSNSGSKTPAPAPAPPSPSAIPPAALAASAPDAFSVLITWTQPAGGTAVDSYSVYRDDSFLGSVNAPATTFEDTTVTPGKKYTYTVKAVAGNVESSLVPVQVKVPTPPLSAARVEGDFNVKVKTVSSSGFINYDSSYTLGWKFRPKCGSGPCNVTWTDLAEKTLKAILTRKGGTYSGSDSGHFNVRCGSTVTTTDITINFHVTKARGIDGEWRATRLDGTMTQDDPSQLGCVHSHADLNITASFLG